MDAPTAGVVVASILGAVATVIAAMFTKRKANGNGQPRRCDGCLDREARIVTLERNGDVQSERYKVVHDVLERIGAEVHSVRSEVRGFRVEISRRLDSAGVRDEPSGG